MPIVNVTVNENNRWKSERERKKKQKNRKEQRGDTSYSESVRA